MRRTILGMAALSLAIGAAWADDLPPLDLSDPVTVRNHMMNNNGKSMGRLAAMAKEEAPYDARVADAAFRAMYATALGFGAQFPEGSDGGSETEAAPAIWTDRAGFEAAVAGFAGDAWDAIQAAPADLEAFKPVFGKVAGNCKACHEKYRISDD